MKIDFNTDNGIGTRATLGVIVLETDETLEPEFARIMDMAGVALYHSRIPMETEITSETLAKMERNLPASVRLLPSAPDFDVIGYGCTSGATVIGSDVIARRVQTVVPNAKVTDPMAAILAAGKALGAKRIGFVTPYVPEVSERMRRKLEQAGFEIAAFGSFEESDDRVVARISESSISKAAQQVAAQSPCDMIVISCTNLRCLNVIPEIETATGVAVVSSNQAMAWHMLRLGGIEDVLPRYGQLFTL